MHSTEKCTHTHTKCEIERERVSVQKSIQRQGFTITFGSFESAHVFGLIRLSLGWNAYTLVKFIIIRFESTAHFNESIWLWLLCAVSRFSIRENQKAQIYRVIFINWIFCDCSTLPHLVGWRECEWTNENRKIENHTNSCNNVSTPNDRTHTQQKENELSKSVFVCAFGLMQKSYFYRASSYSLSDVHLAVMHLQETQYFRKRWSFDFKSYCLCVCDLVRLHILATQDISHSYLTRERMHMKQTYFIRATLKYGVNRTFKRWRRMWNKTQTRRNPLRFAVFLLMNWMQTDRESRVRFAQWLRLTWT